MPATRLSLQRSIKPSFQDGGVCTSSWDASLKTVMGWDGRKTFFMRYEIHIYWVRTPRYHEWKWCFGKTNFKLGEWSRHRNIGNHLCLCLNVSFIFGPRPLWNSQTSRVDLQESTLSSHPSHNTYHIQVISPLPPRYSHFSQKLTLLYVYIIKKTSSSWRHLIFQLKQLLKASGVRQWYHADWATKRKICVKTWSFDFFGPPKARKLKAPPTGFTRGPTSSWSKEAATIISVEVAKAWCLVMVAKVWWHKSATDELEFLAVGLVAEPDLRIPN